MLYALIIIFGALFIVWQLFFSTGGKAKFKSDLPAKPAAASVKKRKGVIICLSILCAISLALLVAAMISFL